MNIRVAVKDDAIKISNLVASLAHFYLNNKEIDLPQWFNKTLTKDEFIRRIASSEYSSFVYELDGEVIGYIAMKGSSHLFHLFVAEKHQGKGLSRELWQFAISVCVSNVYTLRSSLYAVPIYKKFGFVESETAKDKDGIGFQPMELLINHEAS